jgi:transposase InsO family protein
MSKTMPGSTKEEKFRWIKPILDNEISIKQMTLVCPFSKRTLNYWLANFRRSGMDGLSNRSTRPKSHPKEKSIRIRERIIEMRHKTRLCARKLQYKLQKENIIVSTRTIHKVIKKEGLTRRYRIRKIHYKYVKMPMANGDLVEIDIKYVPALIDGKQYYQFTAIDCASRWRYLACYDDCGNFSAVSFLKRLLTVAPFRIKAVKTDNGSCFTNRYTGYQKSTDQLNPRLHAFDLFCMKKNIIHYLIDPGKPAQNGKVERSHRTDQEMFYDRNYFKSLVQFKSKLKNWNNYYNNLEHCALDGLSPNDVLARVQNVCT